METVSFEILKMLENGQRKLAEQRQAIEERNREAKLELERKRLAKLEEVRHYLEEVFPGVMPYADLVGAFQGWEEGYRYGSIDIRIPKFAPISMQLEINKEIIYRGAFWEYVTFYRPDDDELGFEVNEYCVPIWSKRDSRYVMDFGVVLARAQECFQEMEAAQAKWEIKRQELIDEHQRRSEQREVIEERVVKILTCSLAERELLDAVASYLNWLDEDAE